MAILIFASRRSALRDNIYKWQEKLTEITRKLSDLQNYASSVGKGTFSIFDAISGPGSMLGRSMMFIQYAHNTALQNSQMIFQNMQPMIMQQIQNYTPEQQQQYMQYVQMNLYRQEREKIAQLEAKFLNQQEKALIQEKDNIEKNLKMAEQEFEAANSAEDKGIKDAKPKYTAE